MKQDKAGLMGDPTVCTEFYGYIASANTSKATEPRPKYPIYTYKQLDSFEITPDRVSRRTRI
jgi:hypothetical protein